MAVLFAPANFKFVRGTRWDDDVLLSDEDSGDPVDLTGIVRVLMRVRQRVSGPVVAELSTGDGTLDIIDASGGRLGVRCNSAFTHAFPEAGNRRSKYVYDAVIETTPGEYAPAIKGKITVNPQITRPLDP